MKSFNELMQKFVNTDYEELVLLAQKATIQLLPVCKKVDPDNDGLLMLTSLILTAVAADGVLTTLEKKMLCDIFDFSEDTVRKMIAMYDSRMADLADHFVDNLGDDVKADAIVLITAFAAVDEKISKEETQLIKKLLA